MTIAVLLPLMLLFVAFNLYLGMLAERSRNADRIERSDRARRSRR